MKMIGRTIFLLSMTMAFLTACSTPTVSSDDSDEKNPSEKTERDENSSSSKEENTAEESSNSSAKNAKSSSSVGSSELSSSSAGGMKCSALLKGKTEWSWIVPKECRFNPDIDYGSMTDKRDGKVYRTVKIGKQTWMAENLNYADSIKTPSLLERNWCYNDEAKNCDVAGRLYTWAAAIDSVELYDAGDGVDCGYGKSCELPEKVQGICPNGWHLPTEDEWFTLLDEVGGLNNAGEVLKSSMGWYDDSNGTDSVGFSVLPVGYKYGEVSAQYDGEGEGTSFWTATEVDSYRTNSMSFFYNIYILYYFDRKDFGFSVRCLKD